ncbi:DUF1592 domain-containing protein [Luteolibacter pohnpeiensis]|uniref:DUF1592 domain-containing protein n=1 Tax=Luteolibacter pohnpeiensis TaxID=454153 RepID=A0A934VX21_9BACT|nr:DUF1592 domain-containing protein [Luteolibacter pohnpeiensis]MBK1883388.1 DUF1592 domain-containing protein [Luteolibacter pohnpeiensis]
MRNPCAFFLISLICLQALQAEDGLSIYAKQCASCHGDHGQGVADECEDPLQGTRSLESLARYIERRMPEDDPELVIGDDARQVAAYIYEAFYSVDSQSASKPAAEPAFARLTNRQFRESVADLINSFYKQPQMAEGTGLRAKYFESDGMNKKARQGMERVDQKLDFDFGEGAPADGINPEQFSVAWEGSLNAPETGWYEFRMSTPNGARFYLNGDKQNGDSNSRDDSGAKRQTALIDEWVSSGTEVRTSSARIFLLGGRGYPIRLDYFKYKEPRGMVKVEWKPPHSEWELLGVPYLSPADSKRTFVVNTSFPPDDASEGYERGTGISKAWHEATTLAAIEAADEVVSRIGLLTGVKADAPDRVEKLKGFIATFAERAFRRPLDDDARQRYIDHAFAGDVTADQAIKRAVIMILKSPRFLYPELTSEKDDYTIASRLALALWDSIPDEKLRNAAKEGKLRDVAEVRRQTERMAADPRAIAKVEAFFAGWLKLDAEDELQKDPQKFPGFDAAVASDLRRSLQLFVDHVITSETSDYRELIHADYLMLNARLAHYYGVPAPDGDGFHPVKMEAGQRSGILTHPYLLSRLAHEDSTSPIHRGVFLTRNVLGGVLKPPPKAISFEDHPFTPGMSMREKVTEITRSSSCMTCHERINPLGFSLENFDATGRFRTEEDGRPIDQVADFITSSGDTVELKGPEDVANLVLQSPEARMGFIEQLLRYTLKQNPDVYGNRSVDRLEDDFTQSGDNIRKLFMEICAVGALDRIPDLKQAAN